ncbi:MAG: CopG family transcriptional regulator [Candidatus Omnitrophica bacterium]|nr:CopG family transcriptional regulator [Candidatus Omnitrophota bacterium]
MKKHKIDRNMPIGEMTKVNDFLPPPEELIIPERTLKVTLRLNESSIAFFKKQAKKYHTKYQKMIRFLLDKYAEKYSV